MAHEQNDDLFGCSWPKSTLECEFAPPEEPTTAVATVSPGDEDTLCVSIPSYRDSQCPLTVLDALQKAARPARLRICVFEQNEPNDPPGVDVASVVQHFPAAQVQQYSEASWDSQQPHLLEIKWVGSNRGADSNADATGPRIRWLRVAAGRAQGPVWARAMIQQHLFEDEAYYLQIDAHTVFEPGWDRLCIAQLHACGNSGSSNAVDAVDIEHAVLSCYPNDYHLESRTGAPHAPPTFLTLRGFHAKCGFVEMDRQRFVHLPSVPQPSLFWAAGFSFSKGSLVRQVPCDPHLMYMFLGEEISMAARLFTHGYRIFAPAVNVLFHYTPRDYRPVYLEQFYSHRGRCKVDSITRLTRKTLEDQANTRVQQLLLQPWQEWPLNDPYGLGRVASLAAFEAFAGVKLATRQYRARAKQGLTAHPTFEELYCKTGSTSQ